jgi:hypothetical protein
LRQTRFSLWLIAWIVATTPLVYSTPPEAPAASPLQPIDGTKGELTFSWRELSSGSAVLAIWNSSDKGLTVTAKVTDLEPTAPGLSPTTVAIPVTITPNSAKISEFGLIRLTLTLQDKKTLPRERGSYSGVLILEDSDHKVTPFVQHLRINLPGPQAAVSKITFVAWRWVPFSPLWLATGRLPLAAHGGPDEPSAPDRVVGFVHKATGGVAVVRWTSTSQGPGKKPSRARLEIGRLPSAGQFDGDIYLGGMEDRTNPISLTVLAKDIILWPFLVVVLGIYLAWMTKRYVGVLRTTWSLRKQEADLGNSFRQSHQKFAETASGKPYALYSIADDVAAQRVAIRGQLSAIERSWSTTLDNNNTYKTVVAEMQALETQISQWGQLGSQLQALESALQTLYDHLDSSARIPVPNNPDLPDFLSSAREILMGKPLRAADVQPLLAQISDAIGVARAWDGANQQAKQLSETFTDLRNQALDTTKEAAVDAIQTRLVAIWQHLWRAKTAADIAAITAPGGDIDSAQIGMAEISARRQLRMAEGLPGFAATFLTLAPLAGEELAIQSFPSLIHQPDLPASDTRRADMLSRAIHLGDLGSALLAFAIALLTGLNANYLGKPFGTIQDYVTLFLWAAGTKVAIDLVSSVLDKFTSPTT